MDMRIIHIKINNLFESSPLKSRILVLVRRLAVMRVGQAGRRAGGQAGRRAGGYHRLPDGVGTNGVVAEVLQFPLMNFHGKIRATCGNILQHVGKCGPFMKTPCPDPGWKPVRLGGQAGSRTTFPPARRALIPFIAQRAALDTPIGSTDQNAIHSKVIIGIGRGISIGIGIGICHHCCEQPDKMSTRVQPEAKRKTQKPFGNPPCSVEAQQVIHMSFFTGDKHKNDTR